MTAALGLDESGLGVHIVEKDVALGGHGARLCCKARDVCRQCGACIVADKLDRVRSRSGISVLTETELTRVTGTAGEFHASLVRRDNGEETVLDAGAIIVATGFSPFDAKGKPQLGYGTCTNVVTGLELEEQIRMTGSVARPSDGQHPGGIAFVQCVGSRDAHIGNDYCSRVCCKYALRMASLLQSRIAGLEVTIFYMDVQVGGKGFYDFYQTCRQTMRFVRTIPVGIVQTGSGSVEVRYEDIEQGHLVRETFDMIVLSVGMVPAPGTADLASILDIGVNRYGFFDTPDPLETNQSDVDGIFLAGACQGPKDIEGSIAHAQAAAMRTVSFLKRHGRNRDRSPTGVRVVASPSKKAPKKVSARQPEEQHR